MVNAMKQRKSTRTKLCFRREAPEGSIPTTGRGDKVRIRRACHRLQQTEPSCIGRVQRQANGNVVLLAGSLLGTRPCGSPPNTAMPMGSTTCETTSCTREAQQNDKISLDNDGG